MTEAALLTARQLGGRFGFVTFDHRSMALYRPLIESYGFGPQMAAWRVVDSRAVYTPEGARAVDEEVCAAIDDMAVRDGVEVAIISGAVMAGAGRRLQPHCSIPLVEGVAAALVQAEALVRLGAAKPRSGRYAAPQGREAIEISPALAAALRGTQGAQG
jgi:Asp/Glu/hydantoin racemase